MAPTADVGRALRGMAAFLEMAALQRELASIDEKTSARNRARDSLSEFISLRRKDGHPCSLLLQALKEMDRLEEQAQRRRRQILHELERNA